MATPARPHPLMAAPARRALHSVPASAWRWLHAWRRQWPYFVAGFHRIHSPSAGDASAGLDELCYPPQAFATLCRYWRDHCEVIPLAALLARLRAGEYASAPCVSITFDDGYADNAEVAAPILDRFELSATFFLSTSFIGTQRRFPWEKAATPPKLMTWAQARELHAAGFGIGAHTATHRRVSELTRDSLRRELLGSRRRIEVELGEPPQDFAFPFGGRLDCSEFVRREVRLAGFRSCLSCHGGLTSPADSPYHLHRVAISPRYHPRPRDWARAYTRALQVRPSRHW